MAASSSYAAGDLPPELTYSPVPLIALFGLNPSQSTEHASVWEGFTANRQPDRIPIYYKYCSDADFLPAPKVKKTSYEWYIPKGILKTGWIKKHLFEIPAVAVLFLELDFDDVDWSSREEKCVAKVDYVRRQLNGRQSKLAVVLIQRNNVPSDQSLASEKAAQFCVKSNLPANCLFVLPIREDPVHLSGFFYRMEAAFAELAKSYYQSCIRLVRSHRDNMNKTTHQPLLVRHQFKLAFFSELRQDPLSATKHYKTAYNHLLDVRSSPNNLFEIKTMAGFITYKISKLCFISNFPLDAISHFKKHVDIFRNKVDNPVIEFEHHTWLSKQFSIFANLFELAITAGLLPSQGQHPGFYYYEAATEAILRRKTAQKVISNLQIEQPNGVAPHINAEEVVMEYFGQRSWRPCSQAGETLDPEKEAKGIQELQWSEATVNHTHSTIGLLSSAIAHFKRNRCSRLKRYMTVLLAEEYFSAGDYASAMIAFSQVLPVYEQDGWFQISRSILVSCLISAFRLGDGQELLKFSEQFLQGHYYTDSAEEEGIRMCVTDINNRHRPASLPILWNVSPLSDVVWSFPEDVKPSIRSPQPVSNQMSLKFCVASGAVRCRSSSGHELGLPFVTTGQQQQPQPQQAINVPQAAPSLSSSSVTPFGEFDLRQEINSHPVAQNDLLQLVAIIPKTCVSRTPILITFDFVNLTSSLLPLELSIGNNDNFMFSGNKQMNLLLPPASSQTQTYILYPLVCGYVKLPKLRLVAFPDSPQAQPLDSVVESALPEFVQILPKGVSC